MGKKNSVFSFIFLFIPTEMLHEIKIHVENDTLVLRGSPEESVGCVLRGCVILHTRESMKAKSITLNLMGKMKVQWSERKFVIESLSIKLT